MNDTIPTVSGTTRFIAMLGDPVVQVKTPGAFNAFAARTGLDMVMIPMAVSSAGLPAAIGALRSFHNCAGATVTYPHKAAVFDRLDTADAAAHLVGACNVVRRDADGRLHGGMTDGRGFLAALRVNRLNPRGIDVRLIGAGGAGSAIAAALAEAGASRIVVHDLDEQRVAALSSRLAELFPNTKITALEDRDFRPGLICNATPVGMNGEDAVPFPLDGLPADCLVADIVPTPAVTAWLEQASVLGHRIQTGPEMVSNQLGAVIGHILPDLDETPAPRTHSRRST